jgi:hypothetical protein
MDLKQIGDLQLAQDAEAAEIGGEFRNLNPKDRLYLISTCEFAERLTQLASEFFTKKRHSNDQRY